MAEVSYPVHMYKHLHRPRYAHDKKAVDALTLDGWTDIRANIEKQEYPCAVFREDGHVVTVGDYDKDGVIDLEAAQAHEKKLAKQGYGRKAIVIPPPDEAPAPSIGEAVLAAHRQAARIDEQDAQIAAMTKQTAELTKQVSDLLSVLDKSKKPKAGKSKAGKPEETGDKEETDGTDKESEEA